MATLRPIPAMLLMIGMCVLLLRPRPSTAAERASIGPRVREVAWRPLPRPLPGAWTNERMYPLFSNASAPSVTAASGGGKGAHGLGSAAHGITGANGRSRLVHVLTFADRATVYLNALAASVWHYNAGRPLLVLGLAGRRLPRTNGKWNMSRHAIAGADPGKLKKIWFVGALLDDREQLRSLGIRQHDLLLFLDAFDCIVQRPLADFAAAWGRLVRNQLRLLSPATSSTTPRANAAPATQEPPGGGLQDGDAPSEAASLAQREDAAVVLLAEHSCWPWPLPGMQRVGRPRGVSMGTLATAA